MDDVAWAKKELAVHHQLDDRGRRVTVKAGRKREVVLWSGLERMLAKRRDGHATGLVFTDSAGRPLQLGAGDKALRSAFEQIGASEPGRLWHALRHTYATYLRSSRWA